MTQSERLVEGYNHLQKVRREVSRIYAALHTLQEAEVHLGREIKACLQQADEEAAATEQQRAEATLAEAFTKYGELLERLATTNEPDDQPAPPPIEVEMRLTPELSKGAGWAWHCLLAGKRLDGSQGWPPCYFATQHEATARGELWLLALSQQLGVELAAKWKEKESLANMGETELDATRRRESEQRERMKSGLPR